MNLNVIRTLTMRAKTEGVPESTADLNKLKAAHESMAKVTDTSAKGQLSLADAVSKAERRFSTSLRATQDFEKVQRQMNLAVAQNPALQERANAVLALARVHFDQAGRGGKAFAEVQAQINAQAMATAGSLGGFGSALARIGPVGLAVGAVLGAVTLGIHGMVTAANELADKAGKMVDFAETTGLTTTQLQALQKAAAFVGIDADKMGTGFEKFTFEMEKLRRGSGDLFEGLSRLNPALSRQLAETRSAGEAWDVFAKAIANANREQAVALARSAFGRSGAGMVRLAGATTEAGGLAGLEEGLGRVNTLTAEQLKRWDDLGDKINYTSKLAKQNIASIFTEEVLNLQLRWTESFLRFSQEAKNFSLSPDWDKIKEGTDEGTVSRLVAMAKAMVDIVNAKRRAAAEGNTQGGGVGWDFVGFESPSQNLPLPRGRPQELDPRFNAAVLQKQIAAMGEAATAADKLRLAELQLSIASKDAGLSQDQHNRALAVLQQSSDLQQLQTRIGLLGVMATVEEKVEATVNAVSLARMKGAQITDDEARAIINHTRVMAEANTVEGRMRDARESLFKSQTEQSIDRVLQRNGIPPESERGKAIADYMRMTSLLHEMQDIGSATASGFAKDMFNSVDGIEAAANAMVRLRDILTDVLAKKAATALLGGLVDTGSSAVGATTSAGILNGAATTMVAQWIAGASTVAGILTGTATANAGTQVVASTASAGIQTTAVLSESAIRVQSALASAGILVSGATAAAIAIYGPIALLLAAVAVAASLLMSASKKKDEERAAINAAWGRKADFYDRAALAGIDTDTREGAMRAQEIKFQRERFEEAKLGNRASMELQLAHVAEWAALNKEWDKKAIEVEKQKQEEILRIAEEAAKRVLSFQDRLFAATVDTSTLGGAIAAFERDAQREREQEMKDGGQAINDLIAAQKAEEFNIYKKFNEESLAETKRAAETKLREETRQATGILDYLLGLKTGTGSPLAPSARYGVAESAYSKTYGLAFGGNSDALDRLTKDAETFRLASQARHGSGAAYQADFNRIQQQLTALPAVQNSTDPVVVALRDVQAVLNTTAQRQERSYFADTETAVSRIADSAITTNSLLSLILGQFGSLIAIQTQANAAAIAAEQAAAAARATAAAQTAAANAAVTAQNDARYLAASNAYWAAWDEDNPLANGFPPQRVNFGAQLGGMIPGYAGGGMVGNGIYGIDSVRARYAGGGDIMLAGHEYVMPAPQTQRFYPQLEAMRSGLAGNDNSRLERVIERQTQIIGGLLSRIVALEEQGNDKIDENTQATLGQTESLNRETRVAARKAKKAA